MAGSVWTNSEEARLLNELANGTRLDEIAAVHRRTQGAIRARQRRMAVDFCMNGVPLQDVAVRCRLSSQEVEAALARRRISIPKQAMIYIIRDRQDGLNFGYVKTQAEAERICAEIPNMFKWEALDVLDATPLDK